jgi:divalent metal cation (Fe/Co/Zn/Cd) transporter
MAKKEEQEYTRVEKSILPLKYVDLIEDVFHGILAITLLGIGIGAFYYSIERIFTTAPFFPNGMIQGINDILFIVIGVIAAVRHILTVGASLTLQTGKSDTAFERAVIELGLNALIVIALVFAIFMSKSAHRAR